MAVRHGSLALDISIQAGSDGLATEMSKLRKRGIHLEASQVQVD